MIKEEKLRRSMQSGSSDGGHNEDTSAYSNALHECLEILGDGYKSVSKETVNKLVAWKLNTPAE